MTSPPPIATFAHRHRRHLALAALFAAAVVLAVSFVANVHGANRHALEQRGMSSVRDARALGNPKGRPSLQEVQDMLDASAKEAPLEKEGGNKNSLSEAQKFVDEYGSGSFDSIADAPAAPVPVAASEPSLQQQDLPSNVGNSMAMAPPLPGAVQPAYTSLSAHWMPFQAKSGHNAALASKKSKKPGKGDSASKKSKKPAKGDKAADSPADDGSSAPSADVSSSASSQSGSSKCFNVKNLKSFLPPGFGNPLKSKKGSNPFDKALQKAQLPTFGEMKNVVKCVPAVAKSLKAAAQKPKTALSALKTIDKCMTNMADIADKCQSSPGMLALAAVPKVGTMVSYVCGLVSKMVEKYMFVKEHVEKSMSGTYQCSLSAEAVDAHAQLFLAAHAVRHPSEPVVSYHALLRQLQDTDVSELLAEEGVKHPQLDALLAIKSELGGANPVEKIIDKLLKKAQLPTLKDLVKIVKCIQPVGKGLKKLMGKPSISAANAVFKTMDGCMCKLDKLSQQCEGPGVMIISTQDPVGQVVGYVCAMASKAVAKYTVIRDQIQQGLAVVSVVKKVAKGAAAAAASASSSKSSKSKKGPLKDIKKVGAAIAKAGDVLDKGLKKAGLPTFKEMGKVMKCTVTISKSFKSLIKARDSPSLLKVINTMDGCISQLADLSEKCDGPAVMAASMIPMGVGNTVSTVCSTAASVVEKYRGFTGALAAAGFNTKACPVTASASSSVASKSKASKSKAKKSKSKKSKAVKSKSKKSKAKRSKASKSKSKKSKSKKSKSKRSKAKRSKARKGKARKSKRPRRPTKIRAPKRPAIIFRQDRAAPVEGYTPSWNVYLLWTPSMQNMREYSETTMTSRCPRPASIPLLTPPPHPLPPTSEFVRRALRMGSRAETGSIDPHESHFLTGGFDSPKFTNDLANTCCSVIVAPPFENGFDVYSPADKTEARIQQVRPPHFCQVCSCLCLIRVLQRLRDYVANGNSIVVTGGIMSQIFLNRNFLTQVRSLLPALAGPVFFPSCQHSPSPLPAAGTCVG